MTVEKIDESLQKVRSQIDILKLKEKNLLKEKKMAQDAEEFRIFKQKATPETIMLLEKLSAEEINRLLGKETEKKDEVEAI